MHPTAPRLALAFPSILTVLAAFAAGCSLPLYGLAQGDDGGVSPAIPTDTPSLDADAQTSPAASFAMKTSDSGSTASAADAAVDPPSFQDASAANPLGRTANPDAFTGCLANCPTGCCDPSGICWAPSRGSGGIDLQHCGNTGVACTDCTAYGASCNAAGLCAP